MTTSATPTETFFEPSLPPISRRRPLVALDRAAQSRQVKRHNPPAHSGVAPGLVASLLVIAALMISQALILRDANQILLHQRDVAPGLAR